MTSTKPVVIYLDQNHWISLAKARTGHPGGDQYKGLLQQLIRLVGQRKVILPLSSTHYMELQGNNNFRQRKDVAETMALLSSFNTLSGIDALHRAEMERALSKRFGIPKHPIDIKPLGWGYKFAFTGVSAWMTFTGPPESVDLLKARFENEEKYKEWLINLNTLSELIILRGPSDDEVDTLRSQYDYRPEEAIEFGNKRVRREQELEQLLLEQKEAKWSQLSDIVIARTLYSEVGDLLEEMLNLPGIDMTPDKLIKLGGKDWLVDLANDIPSLAGIIVLAKANHRTTSRPWTKNDIHDIDALTEAIPYCDIVVTEKHAATHMQNAHLDDRFNTRILRKLEDLPAALEKALAITLNV